MYPDQTYYTEEQATAAIMEVLGGRDLDPDLYDLDAIRHDGMRLVPDLDKYTFRAPAQFWAVVDAHRKQGPSEEAGSADFLAWVNEHRDKA